MKKLFLLASAFMVMSVSLLGEVQRFDYHLSHDNVFFTVGNLMFLVQPESIISSGNMLYFAASDFTTKRDLIVAKTKDIEVVVDEESRKVVKATFLLADDKQRIHTDYELVLMLEIRKGFPFLAIYSKFFYTGEGTRECGINWALEATHEKYRYYTIPQRGENRTFRLVQTRRNKIGQANWIFANTGKGVGAGLIAPAALLGKGEDFIFLHTAPSKKRLGSGESLDLFMILVPINQNFRILPEIFESVKDIRWEY